MYIYLIKKKQLQVILRRVYYIFSNKHLGACLKFWLKVGGALIEGRVVNQGGYLVMR